ncbi:MAG: penicillin-binding transpeptidase domain-containing protein [Limosilactobacillus sp.]|uniref:penicillin-binding transpeptidase domain-containing protein n=1 Tax=Limosilactobacillus sp. TaxID=2773925 RepID=UPI00270DB5DE|nr:penicillin-binding transpeptidase domain-containing protein [Limosilactobacillus sp.]
MNREPKRTIKKEKNQKKFGQSLFFMTLIVFSFFIGRFFYIAILRDVQHVNLAKQAEQVYTQRHTITAKRGDILDAKGNAIAADTNRYTLYAVLDKSQVSTNGKPLYVKDKKKTARVLSKYLKLSYSDILARLEKNKNAFQVEFGSAGSNLSVAQMQRIKSHNLPGIDFVSTPARSYPEGEFASQILGLATSKTDDSGQTKLYGQIGLEQYFNKQLTGTNGLQTDKQDVYGYRLANSQVVTKKAINGDNVYTTIEPKIQHMLENRVAKVYKDGNPDSVSAIVMDTRTGRIVAATQRPTMRTKKNPVWRNMFVQDAYEPGSTMKILALSASVDSGHFNPNATFQSGTWAIGGGKITDWSTSGWGTITYKDAFDMSSNVGFAHIEQDMGAKTWMKYIKRFGLLKKVNVVGMSGETAGYTQFHGILEQANTSFGQGITVNQMQMLRAIGAVANNGKMMQPYIINKVVKSNGKVVEKTKPKKVGQPISKSSAKQVRKYMEGVIYDEKGLGHAFQIKGYRVAGKTGTAQIGGANGYSKGDTNYLYSFAGMAPAKNPRYVIYITLRRPKNLTKPATKQMASIFNPVMKALLSKNKASHTNEVKVPNVVGQNVDDANKTISNLHLQSLVIGDGKKVKNQSVASGSILLKNQRIILNAGGTIKMPDISGWSAADVQQLAETLNLKLKEKGTGYVDKQSIKANDKIHKNQTLTVTYKSKE